MCIPNLILTKIKIYIIKNFQVPFLKLKKYCGNCGTQFLLDDPKNFWGDFKTNQNYNINGIEISLAPHRHLINIVNLACVVPPK